MSSSHRENGGGNGYECLEGIAGDVNVHVACRAGALGNREVYIY